MGARPLGSPSGGLGVGAAALAGRRQSYAVAAWPLGATLESGAKFWAHATGVHQGRYLGERPRTTSKNSERSRVVTLPKKTGGDGQQPSE